MKNNSQKELNDFLNSYNECFYQKNIEELKKFYDTKNNRLIYFDNHKNNDTWNLEQHFNLLSIFFKNGKTTESGAVEPITMENINIFQKVNAACVCFYARYKSLPDIAVRCTYYLEKMEKKWKIIHAHGSFEP
jgi:hypothetical protein